MAESGGLAVWISISKSRPKRCRGSQIQSSSGVRGVPSSHRVSNRTWNSACLPSHPSRQLAALLRPTSLVCIAQKLEKLFLL